MTKPARILDKQRLIQNGRTAADRRARRLCIEAFEEALGAVDPALSVANSLKAMQGRIRVGNVSINAAQKIRILAVGKASASMLAKALAILGRRVLSAILVAPYGENLASSNKRVTSFHTAHPIPDANGVRASRHVMAMIERMDVDELLLCLISGGASAMLPAPVHGVTLDDKRRLTQLLIHSQASIHQVNTVRRHLSELKGGRLIEHCRAGRVISLIMSDVPANTLCDIASGLTAPDPTTFRDAADVFSEFKLWNVTPGSIRTHLRRGLTGNVPETPKPGDKIFQKVRNFIVADNRTACEAAKRAMVRTKIPTKLLTSSLDMDARKLGTLLGSAANNAKLFGKSLRRPCGVVLGGETTVNVTGSGKGGRNQEVALAALPEIAGLNGVAIATLGTDGIDGNSPAAGALIDSQSTFRAVRLGLQVSKFKAKNDSYNLFRKLGDAIVTGRTGTNVGDLYLLVLTSSNRYYQLNPAS